MRRRRETKDALPLADVPVVIMTTNGLDICCEVTDDAEYGSLFHLERGPALDADDVLAWIPQVEVEADFWESTS